MGRRDLNDQSKGPVVPDIPITSNDVGSKATTFSLIKHLGDCFPVAKCDQGYLCEVCGKEVTSIVDSDLYLRYVIGQLDAETLHLSPERHLRCNPTLAQYIVDEGFEPIRLTGPFAKENLDEVFVAAHTAIVTRGYQRLWQINESSRPISLLDYPLDGDDPTSRTLSNQSPTRKGGRPSPARPEVQ